MHKTIAIISATGALLFGGAGVASATVSAPVSSSTSTTLADNMNGDTGQHNDNSGKWGMFGLLGLFGLAGLKRRNTVDTAVDAGPTATRGRV